MVEVHIILNKDGRRKIRRPKDAKPTFFGYEVRTHGNSSFVVLYEAQAYGCRTWAPGFVDSAVLMQTHIPADTAPMTPGFYGWRATDKVNAIVDYSPPDGKRLNLVIWGDLSEVIDCYYEIRGGLVLPTFSWKKKEEKSVPNP